MTDGIIYLRSLEVGVAPTRSQAFRGRIRRSHTRFGFETISIYTLDLLGETKHS